MKKIFKQIEMAVETKDNYGLKIIGNKINDIPAREVVKVLKELELINNKGEGINKKINIKTYINNRKYYLLIKTNNKEAVITGLKNIEIFIRNCIYGKNSIISFKVNEKDLKNEILKMFEYIMKTTNRYEKHIPLLAKELNVDRFELEKVIRGLVMDNPKKNIKITADIMCDLSELYIEKI